MPWTASRAHHTTFYTKMHGSVDARASSTAPETYEVRLASRLGIAP
jgi:hypothetical protein